MAAKAPESSLRGTKRVRFGSPSARSSGAVDPEGGASPQSPLATGGTPASPSFEHADIGTAGLSSSASEGERSNLNGERENDEEGAADSRSSSPTSPSAARPDFQAAQHQVPGGAVWQMWAAEANTGG